jgi:hypothetical protein
MELLNLKHRRHWRPNSPVDLRDLLEHVHLNPSSVVLACQRVTGWKPSAHELLEHRVLPDGCIVGRTRTPVCVSVLEPPSWRQWRFRIEAARTGVRAYEREATFERAY